MSICILMSNIEKIVYIKILYFHEKDLRIWNYLYFDENREKFTWNGCYLWKIMFILEKNCSSKVTQSSYIAFKINVKTYSFRNWCTQETHTHLYTHGSSSFLQAVNVCIYINETFTICNRICNTLVVLAGVT